MLQAWTKRARLGPLRRGLSTGGIKRVGVVGMGLMGHGIAQAAAAAGYTVVGVDANAGVLEAGRKNIEASVTKLNAKLASKGTLTPEAAAEKTEKTMANLTFASSTDALADVDLIVEAIVENLAVKKTFYEALGKVAGPKCIFASNTSSLKITPMAEASGRPELFVGLHFFNPVQLMPLVEVVRTAHTSDAVFLAADAWAKSCGKTTVECQDTPGFIVNRLLVPNIAAAIMMVERGDASVADVDMAMRLGAGQPMGPLTLADYVGLDTCLAILQGWCVDYPNDPAFYVPKSLAAKVAAGKLGRKSGEGYYVWGDGVASTKPTAVSGV